MNEQLIDPKAFHSTLKRLFNNTVEVIIQELLQNAQRSKASKIKFDTRYDHNTIVITDNGSGIENFNDLLIAGRSNYCDEGTLMQHPMGVGFYSLLACDKIVRVAVISKGQKVSIDTQRWWNDYEYAVSWRERLESTTAFEGTRIELSYSHYALDQEFIQILRDKDLFAYKNILPAQGYFIMDLAVHLNEEILSNRYPKWLQTKEVLLETQYQDCRLIIYHPKQRTTEKQLINWYGQIVRVNTNIPFGFVLEVSQNRPVNLLSPVRSGVIEDRTWDNFTHFVVEAIANYYTCLKTTPPCYLVLAYWELRTYYRHLPRGDYYTAWQIIGYRQDDGEAEVANKSLEVLKYDDEHLVLNQELQVLFDDEDESFEAQFGYESFVSCIDRPVYVPNSYDEQSLLLQTIFWQPGEVIIENEITFTEPGVFAVAESVETARWQPVTCNVYALKERTSSNLDSAEHDWKIGCMDSPVDALEEYKDAAYEIGIAYYRDCYLLNVNQIAIELDGNTIRSNPNKIEIIDFIRTKMQLETTEISSPGIIFDDDNQSLERFANAKRCQQPPGCARIVCRVNGIPQEFRVKLKHFKQ